VCSFVKIITTNKTCKNHTVTQFC